MQLSDYFSLHPRGALAFSGGTDSAYLLWAARAAGAQVQPYFLQTPFQPPWEREDAMSFCRTLGIPLRILELDALACPEIQTNPPDRCYHCKHLLFTALTQAARQDGWPLVWEGTNASDDAVDRPGMKALAQLGVESPLRLCGLTKAEIRARSRAAGLSTWDKPSYACLATRFPAGMPLTAEGLDRIAWGERTLFHLGFSDLRLRLRPEGALLQLPLDQHPAAQAQWEEICRALAPQFPLLRLDPVGRPPSPWKGGAHEAEPDRL